MKIILPHQISREILNATVISTTSLIHNGTDAFTTLVWNLQSLFYVDELYLIKIPRSEVIWNVQIGL